MLQISSFFVATDVRNPKFIISNVSWTDWAIPNPINKMGGGGGVDLKRAYGMAQNHQENFHHFIFIRIFTELKDLTTSRYQTHTIEENGL